MRLNRNSLRALSIAALACVAIVMSAFSSGQQVRAETGVSIDFFVETLAPHGEWVEHPRHGRVWYPRDVDHDWRPYTRGRWVNTEEHGWMWVSDEEWGWGPYHYGRWDFDDRYGWVWIPGYDWGPAWVEWRSGGGYIGWAPMPPTASWSDGGLFYTERFDYYAPRYRPAWVFVQEVHFIRPSLYTFCTPPARNITIINKTTNVTNYTFINKTVINKSINVKHIENVTKTTVPTVKVENANTPVLGGSAAKTANSVAVFKPIVKTEGKATLAAGVTTAAVVQSAKAKAPAKVEGEPPKLNAAAPGSKPPVAEGVVKGNEKNKIAGTQQSGTQPTNKSELANKPAQTNKPTAPVTLKSEAKPKVDAPNKPAPSAKTAVASPPRDDSRLKAIQERQKAEREATRQRQQQERSKAALLQKPAVIRDQVRERLEQRRIQTQQRQVVQNRPVPPRVQAQAQAPKKPAPAQQAQKKPQPQQQNGQQPPR